MKSQYLLCDAMQGLVCPQWSRMDTFSILTQPSQTKSLKSSVLRGENTRARVVILPSVIWLGEEIPPPITIQVTAGTSTRFSTTSTVQMSTKACPAKASSGEPLKVITGAGRAGEMGEDGSASGNKQIHYHFSHLSLLIAEKLYTGSTEKQEPGPNKCKLLIDTTRQKAHFVLCLMRTQKKQKIILTYPYYTESTLYCVADKDTNRAVYSFIPCAQFMIIGKLSQKLACTLL